MIGLIRQEWKRLLTMDTFSLELFLFFYSGIYGFVWLLPGETFQLDTYQLLRFLIDESLFGKFIFAVSVLGLITARFDHKRGRIFSLVVIMIFWLCLGATFIIATPLSASGYGFLFCGVAAGWAAAQYGGKPGCPALPFVPGNQSMQAGYVKLDRYIANRFTNGNALTAPITIPNDGSGSVLHVNVEPIAAGGYLKAQIETPLGVVIPGFDIADCIGVNADKVLDGVIRWTGGTLKSLAGQDVKIRLFGNGVDFYSMWLKADNLSVSYQALNTQAGNAVNIAPAINADTPVLSATLVSGGLPSGVNLDANTGVLSGSANSAGSGSAQIKFTSYGNEQVAIFDWTVTPVNPACPPPTFQYSSLIQTTQGIPVSVIPTGIANVHHFEHFGLLHAGLNFNQATGEISGTPSNYGTYPLKIRAFNSCGDYLEEIIAIRVTQASPNQEGKTPGTMFGEGYLTFVVNTTIGSLLLN